MCCTKTGGDCGQTEEEWAANLVAVDVDTCCVKHIPCPSKATSDYIMVMLRKFLFTWKEGKRSVRCDVERATKAILHRLVADMGNIILS